MGIVQIALYLDDNFMVGDVEAIVEVLAALKKNGLVLKFMEGQKDILSCDVVFSRDKKITLLGQPHLIHSLENK